jgi:hypothetical protein
MSTLTGELDAVHLFAWLRDEGYLVFLYDGQLKVVPMLVPDLSPEVRAKVERLRGELTALVREQGADPACTDLPEDLHDYLAGLHPFMLQTFLATARAFRKRRGGSLLASMRRLRRVWQDLPGGK